MPNLSFEFLFHRVCSSKQEKISSTSVQLIQCVTTPQARVFVILIASCNPVALMHYNTCCNRNIDFGPDELRYKLFEHSVIVEALCTVLFQQRDLKTLCTLSCVSHLYRKIASDDGIWKKLCIEKWPELNHATDIDKEPFPAWKRCFRQKYKEPVTTLNDLMTEFGDCDWYACKNGHLYLIGECRLPMIIGRCPACGARIGGKNHRMLRDNQRLGSVVNKELKDYKLRVEDVEKVYKKLKQENELRSHSVEVMENEQSDDDDNNGDRANDRRDNYHAHSNDTKLIHKQSI